MAQVRHPHPAVILVLKSLMVLLLAFAAAIQIWLLPAIAADFAADAPDFHYRYPAVSHIDRWLYSSPESEKVIESVFSV